MRPHRLCMVAAISFALLSVDRSIAEVTELSDIRISPDAIETKVPHAAMRGIDSQKSVFHLNNAIVAERLFYETGQLAEEKLFRDGKLHGIWMQFHESGKPFSQRPFRDGLADGVFRFWGADGQVLGQSRMAHGTGVLREYGLSGLESHDAETSYVDGRIHGYRKVWGRFHRGIGRGVDITEFNEGEPNGWSATFDEDGVQLSSAYYKDGQFNGVLREWNRDGKMLDQYPKHYLLGAEVSKEAFEAAAQSDKLLQKSLKNDGSQLKIAAFSEEKLESSNEPPELSPKHHDSATLHRSTPESVVTSNGKSTPAVAVTRGQQSPALTREERIQLERMQFQKTLLRYSPAVATGVGIVLAILIWRRSAGTRK